MWCSLRWYLQWLMRENALFWSLLPHHWKNSMAHACIRKQPMWWWANQCWPSPCCTYNLKSPCCNLLHLGVQFLWGCPLCQDRCVHQLWCRNVSLLFPCHLCTEGGTPVWGCSRGGKERNLDIQTAMTDDYLITYLRGEKSPNVRCHVAVVV